MNDNIRIASPKSALATWACLTVLGNGQQQKVYETSTKGETFVGQPLAKIVPAVVFKPQGTIVPHSTSTLTLSTLSKTHVILNLHFS
jgi:hypothetical protein